MSQQNPHLVVIKKEFGEHYLVMLFPIVKR